MTEDSTVNQLTVSPGVSGRHVELLQKNRWFRGLPPDAISEMVAMARLNGWMTGNVYMHGAIYRTGSMASAAAASGSAAPAPMAARRC